jgi:hypothetical protein
MAATTLDLEGSAFWHGAKTAFKTPRRRPRARVYD